MTQPQIIALLLRIFLLSGFASITLWMGLYTAWTRGKWRNNLVGRTIVVKDTLIALLLIPTALALFFHLSGADSLTAAWADVVLIGLITPVMCWRIIAWSRLRPADRKRRHDPSDNGTR